MEKAQQQIAWYRKRLDKTLASPDLTNKQSLKTLVKNHLIRSSLHETDECSENAVEKRTNELYNFLDMLRSASVNDKEVPKTQETSSEWKLKQDNDELRVMYREGPPGTRLHSLLVEGYIEGPANVCLCVSWESTLYRKWWPQFVIPTFKVTSSQCLQKVRVGEQIALVRMKFPWPLSPREAVVHYFEFEYFQDDLIVVLLSTASELESIGTSIQGCIPEAKDAVRMDLLGGFAYQKVSSDRTYFRKIGNLDLKMDFVPPSFINFIARQIVVDGFRLYEKAVASAYNSDEDFSKALKDPLYTRIHKALYSTEQPSGDLEQKELKSAAHVSAEVPSINTIQDDSRDMDQNVNKDQISDQLLENMLVRGKTDKKMFGEIVEMEEEEGECIRPSKEGLKSIVQLPTKKIDVNRGRSTFISREVEQALGMLEKVIYMVREHGYTAQSKYSSGFTNEGLPEVEDGGAKDSIPSNGKCSNSDDGVEIIGKKNSNELSFRYSGHKFRSSGSNSHSMHVNHNRIAPASPEEILSNPSETHQAVLCTSTMTETPIPNKIEHDSEQARVESTGIKASPLNGGNELEKQRKQRLCCMNFNILRSGAR